MKGYAVRNRNGYLICVFPNDEAIDRHGLFKQLNDTRDLTLSEHIETFY